MVSTESVKDIIRHLDDAQKLEILEYLKKEVSVYEVEGKKVVSEHAIPISCFKHGLSGLETISVYMKEDVGMRFADIAKEINRSAVTVRLSYRNAKAKHKGRLDVSDAEIRIPVALLKDRKKTALQHVVAYLKDRHKISFKEIALLMDRDYKTIWTAYSRGGRK